MVIVHLDLTVAVDFIASLSAIELPYFSSTRGLTSYLDSVISSVSVDKILINSSAKLESENEKKRCCWDSLVAVSLGLLIFRISMESSVYL